MWRYLSPGPGTMFPPVSPFRGPGRLQSNIHSQTRVRGRP